MRSLRLIATFIKASFQEEAAYRANFFASFFASLLNLGTGVLGLYVLFNQVKVVHGWDFPATLTLLGVYLTASALRGLFIGPSLEALAGMDGEIWSGKFDFTLLRPVNTQFRVSLHKWRLFALFDLLLGLGVLGVAIAQRGVFPDLTALAAFGLGLLSGILILYAILLTFAGLVFWSPAVMFTWVFDGVFQLARFPVGMYPGWLRLTLTWIIPVGVITTLPAEALQGKLGGVELASGLGLALLMALGASMLFRHGLRHYASASS
jgi:ABC-2 type transport system permease protein